MLLTLALQIPRHCPNQRERHATLPNYHPKLSMGIRFVEVMSKTLFSHFFRHGAHTQAYKHAKIQSVGLTAADDASVPTTNSNVSKQQHVDRNHATFIRQQRVWPFRVVAVDCHTGVVDEILMTSANLVHFE
jgi:hypothetical protein